VRDAGASDHRRVAEDGRRAGEVIEESNAGTVGDEVDTGTFV
jgi:hypothetical protein